MVNAHLGDVSITPNQETNFSPDFSRLIVPISKQQIRPDFHDFIIEFYDINNNVIGDVYLQKV